MSKPIIMRPGQDHGEGEQPMAALGGSLVIEEWSGGGPPYLHVHHADDEAWHVLTGTLRFKFQEGEVDAPAGTTVFVPAGVAHTYWEPGGPARYLIIMTPRLRELVATLHATPFDQHGAVMRRFESEIVG